MSVVPLFTHSRWEQQTYLLIRFALLDRTHAVVRLKSMWLYFAVLTWRESILNAQ